jgi:hypothetical protein
MHIFGFSNYRKGGHAKWKAEWPWFLTFSKYWGMRASILKMLLFDVFTFSCPRHQGR